MGVRIQPPFLPSDNEEIVIEYVELSPKKIQIRTPEVFALPKGCCITLDVFHRDVFTQYTYDCVIDFNFVDNKLKTWWVNNQLFKALTIEEYQRWKSKKRNNTINKIIK